MFMISKIYLKKNLIKNNFLMNYLLIFYSALSSKFEIIFFKKNKFESNLILNGYDFYQNKINLDFGKYNFIKVEINKYLTKYIFKENDLKDIVNSIFIKNSISNLITAETGFEYSIDFITAYETKNISEDDLNHKWYANHWHKDKPFSKNTLKIILPLEDISENHGGIEIKKKENETISYKMISNKTDFLAFFPNRCFHKAGNPEYKFVRKQLMIQLNPSTKWKLNSKVFLRQKNIEPKFPLFKYIFDKKIDLQELF